MPASSWRACCDLTDLGLHTKMLGSANAPLLANMPLLANVLLPANMPLLAGCIAQSACGVCFEVFPATGETRYR